MTHRPTNRGNQMNEIEILERDCAALIDVVEGWDEWEHEKAFQSLERDAARIGHVPETLKKAREIRAKIRRLN